MLQVLLVRDLHRTWLTKSAELRWGACRFKPLCSVAVSGIIATLWLPTSAALVGHLGLFSWPRGVFHGPAVSALSICPPALYVCVLSRLLASEFLAQASSEQTPSSMVPKLWVPLLGVYPPPPDLPMQGPLGFPCLVVKPFDGSDGTRPTQRATVRTVGDLPDAPSTVLPNAIAGGRGCVAPYASHLSTLLFLPYALCCLTQLPVVGKSFRASYHAL